MNDVREVYAEAASKAGTKEERLGLWTVFGYYWIRETGEGDAIAVAGRTVPKDVKVRKSQRDTRSFDIRLDGHDRRIRRRNIGEPYMLLEDHPDLFDRFARLANQGEIGREEWLDWLHEYGVLGVLSDRTRRYQRNQETDSFSRFVKEGLLANRTLRLFEVAANPDGPDAGTIRELLPEEYSEHVRGEPDGLESAALWTIQKTVEEKVHAGCYERLIPRDTGEWRKKNMSPFAREWGFNSLLGAMWLQFMWLITMNGLRYCKAPDCNRHISPYARPDKITCSPACRKSLQRSKQNK